MIEPLLRVRDLTVEYCGSGGFEQRAVDKVSFDIVPGETVALLGESGCGKTTLALALIRLLPQAARIVSGSIRFRGREMLRQNESQLRKVRGAEVSIIFQDPEMALNPVMRVGDQIIDVLRAHTNWNRRRCRDEAECLLRQVRLSDAHIYFAYPHQLSGGECQRVVITQALACKPAFLIADEPTSSLDNTRQAEVLDLLKELKEHLQLSLLFITHNPSLLTGLADRALVMYAGRIVEEGALGQVLQEPRHPYTKGLLRSIPPSPGKHVNECNRALPALPDRVIRSHIWGLGTNL